MLDVQALYKAYPLYQELFFEQLLLALSPSRFVAALCGRRSGKTTACIVRIVQDLLYYPRSLSFYLALTDDSVRYIVMPIFEQIAEKYKIQYKIVEDEICFTNGSKLLYAGANNIRKIETYRGTKLRSAAIDEAASFSERLLAYLIDEILTAALMDLEGPMFLVGTPASHCRGIFHSVTTGQEPTWDLHKWNAYQNPHVCEQFKKSAALFLERKKCDESNPKFRREFLGEWCTDEDHKLFAVVTTVADVAYNTSTWKCAIGIDFGFHDKTAFSVVGWKQGERKAYILETCGESAMTISQIAKTLLTLKHKYKPFRIVADSAGGSKIIIEDFNQKYNLHLLVAQKSAKAHYIGLTADALLNEELVACVPAAQGFVDEASRAVWDEKRARELEGCECDYIDATLYAYRECLAYLEKLPEIKQQKTSEELEREMLQKQIDADLSNIHDDDDFYNELGGFLE